LALLLAIGLKKGGAFFSKRASFFSKRASIFSKRASFFSKSASFFPRLTARVKKRLSTDPRSGRQLPSR
jgi:hypothetical protein